ncbi:MAG TPA: T9SS type A sorting domain-containing protein [Candidatus Acidoferrales bacterium]|nr:T9SS type A sorting domain-containing protein [Candidatus Acidoferrales bacterium]
MNTIKAVLSAVLLLGGVSQVFGQSGTNCFLQDYYPKTAAIPLYRDTTKTNVSPNVIVTIDGTDTLGEISNYVFGNAVATWVSQDVNNPTLLGYLQLLSPTLIRYPGGSWSDVFFWSGNPGDLPDSIYDASNYYGTGAVKQRLSPELGPSLLPTPESYYNMRDQLYTQGLITINYAYARYGRSNDPVAQAAHYAADWVRYDDGRTEFWEIGNEDNRPWEAGFLIDTSKNKDHQPAVISGDLYGKHFKIFVDSMKAAANGIGATIYVGGQINQYHDASDWIVADRNWNQQFFNEVGDTADFYVIHDYYGNNATSIKGQVDNGVSEIDADIASVRQDISNFGAAPMPIALTEWNCSSANNSGSATAETSIANGMQAVALFCEMIKNNMGMSARWLIANWNTDGMFYNGNDGSIPQWNPRPDFYYIYYLNQVIGDHVVSATVPGGKGIYAYATRFSSGHTGVVVVNDGSTSQTVMLNPKSIGVGDRFYVYTLTGVDNSTWPQSVVVNGHGPSATRWGPLDSLQQIPALAYPVDDTIEFASPANSVEYVLVDSGSRNISSVHGKDSQTPYKFELGQNYPNPFNPTTDISYQLMTVSHVTLKIYDVLGREIATLVDGEQQPGEHIVRFDGSNLSSGVYFYRMKAGDFVETKKLMLIR